MEIKLLKIGVFPLIHFESLRWMHSISAVSRVSAAHPPHPLQPACDNLRSSAPEGLGMLPGLAQSWITAVLCTLPFMANHGTGKGEEGDRHTRGPALFSVEADLRPSNIVLFFSWHRAQDRTAWSGLIRTAMPQCAVRS